MFGQHTVVWFLPPQTEAYTTGAAAHGTTSAEDGTTADNYAEELACCLIRYLANNTGKLEGCVPEVVAAASDMLRQILEAFRGLRWSYECMKALLGERVQDSIRGWRCRHGAWKSLPLCRSKHMCNLTVDDDSIGEQIV